MAANVYDRYSRLDWWMVVSSAILVGFGLLLIYSLTWPEDNRLMKQIIFFVMGMGIVFVLQLFDAHFWRNASIILYAAVVLLLMGLLFFGEATRGTRGWIRFGPVALQVAEFAKVATILFLATTLEKLHFDLARFRHVVLCLIIIGIPSFLALLQPDFGSTFIIMVSGGIMLLYTGLDRKKLAILIVGGLVVASIGWFAALQDYQKERVLTFLNPQSDPLGSGYNVTQSIVAIGSGGLWGRGIGLGTQSQLNFLPEQETDFIFASLAEELGFVGSSVFLAVYLFFLWRMYHTLSLRAHLFNSFIVIGVFAMFLTQTVVNVGMNMGLFPVTGITLPFVSYGGSSLIVSFISLGLIQNMRS